jgi:hypothetical protein
MRQASTSIKINSNQEAVWDVLFNQFGDVNNFNPLIEGSKFTKGETGELGCERMCTLSPNNVVHERISRVEQGKNFDIEIFEGGLPMMDKMIGRFDIYVISENQTEVKITMNYTTKPAFMGGLMKGKMIKLFDKMVIGLKYHLETGDLVTKENIKRIQHEYNSLNGNESFQAEVQMAS